MNTQLTQSKIGLLKAKLDAKHKAEQAEYERKIRLISAFPLALSWANVTGINLITASSLAEDFWVSFAVDTIPELLAMMASLPAQPATFRRYGCVKMAPASQAVSERMEVTNTAPHWIDVDGIGDGFKIEVNWFAEIGEDLCVIKCLVPADCLVKMVWNPAVRDARGQVITKGYHYPSGPALKSREDFKHIKINGGDHLIYWFDWVDTMTLFQSVIKE